MADDDLLALAHEVEGQLMALIRGFAEKNNIQPPILLPALAMACVNLAYGASTDGRELEAIKYHRSFLNRCCDEIIEGVAEGKL